MHFFIETTHSKFIFSRRFTFLKLFEVSFVREILLNKYFLRKKGTKNIFKFIQASKTKNPSKLLNLSIVEKCIFYVLYYFPHIYLLCTLSSTQWLQDVKWTPKRRPVPTEYTSPTCSCESTEMKIS